MIGEADTCRKYVEPLLNAASVVNQSRPSLRAASLPVLARSRRCEALRPERAAASRNDNKSSAKAASERGYG